LVRPSDESIVWPPIRTRAPGTVPQQAFSLGNDPVTITLGGHAAGPASQHRAQNGEFGTPVDVENARPAPSPE
jgi:hypothetical protein